MTQYIWRLINVWIGKEATRWTVATNFDYIPKLSFSFDDKIETTKNESSIWKLAGSIGACAMQKRGEWEIEGVLSVNNIWFYFLNMLWGIKSVETNAGTGVYKHTFSLTDNNLHPSMSISVVEPNQNVVFPLAMLSELNITAEPGKCMNYTANFIAKSSKTASNTASYTKDYTMNANNLNVKIANSEAELATASKLDLLKFDLSFSTDLETIYTIWENEPDEIYNNVINITGSFEMTYNWNEYKDMMINREYKTLWIEIEDAGKIIGTVADKPRINIILPRVGLQEYSRTTDADAIVKQSVGFEAFYDIEKNEFVKIEVTNTKANY